MAFSTTARCSRVCDLVDTLKLCFEWGITLFLASDTSLLVKISTKRWQTSLQFFSGQALINSSESHAIFSARLSFMWLHPHVVVLFFFQTKFKVMINVSSKHPNMQQLYSKHERFHCRKVLMFIFSVFKPGELSYSRS